MRKELKMKSKTVSAVLIIFIFLFSLFNTSPLYSVEKDASVEKVAMVNGKIIPVSELDRAMAMLNEQFLRSGKPLNNEKLPEIKKNVLEDLIDFEVLYQESQKAGIKVDAKMVNDQFENWKKQFTNESEFKKALAELKITEAGIKGQIEKGMAVQQLTDKAFGQKVSVSDQEIKNFYENHPDFFKIPEQVHASHILITIDPQADPPKKAEARKKIDEIQMRLKKGDDFAELAKTVSQCPSSSKGGDLGYFGRGQMVEPFEKVAFSLKPGEVSGVVETNFGFHIIKVLDKKPETIVAYGTVKDRLASMLKKEKIQKETDQYLVQLKKVSKIERYLQ